MTRILHLLAIAAAMLVAAPATAQTDYAARLAEGDHRIADFRFASGERLPLTIHYATLGTPRRDAGGRIVNAVLLLHGTGGSGRQFLQPQFADMLFGPGQPLDITRFYIVMPDGIGHGHSSKPSDGLRMRFPAYDYDDMVAAQHALVTDHLKVSRLRLLFGTSMGCMHGFQWAVRFPDAVKAMMPMACQPTAIVGHNRMWRRAAIEGIRADPAWAGGVYQAQPVLGLRTAVSLLHMAGFAPLHLQRSYATRAAADDYIVARIAADLKTRDANDLLYQLDASRTYDPSGALDRIATPMTWINSADDAINPVGYGIPAEAARRLRTARVVLLPASADTRGHSSHTWATLWKDELVDLLRRTE